MKKINRLLFEFKDIISKYDKDFFVDDFEGKLNEIYLTKDSSIIAGLVDCLEDNFDFDELMFSIIHTMESFDDNIYITEILKTIPNFIEKSPRWASIVFLRVLNSESCNNVLLNKMNTLSDIQKKSLIKLFVSIGNIDEEFKIKVTPILDTLNL